MRRTWRVAAGRWISLVLVISLVAAACGDPAISPTPAPPTAAAPARDLDAGAVVDLLAEAGIATFDDVLDATPAREVTEPASPVAVIRWQVDNLAREAATGGGVPGTALDALGAEIGLGPGQLPVSYLLAGWITAAATPGARQAAELMGNVNWVDAPAAVFPNLVLLLFFSDVAVEAVADAGIAGVGSSSSAASPPLDPLAGKLAIADTPVILAPAPASATCPDLQQWIDDILGTVFGALKLPGGSGVLGFFAGIWNAGLDLAKAALRELISDFGESIMTIVQAVAAGVGAIAYFASFLSPWAVQMISSGPENSHFAHPGEPDHDFPVTAKVVTDQGSWEETVVSCAEQANVTLPDPSVGGKRVEWQEDTLADRTLHERIRLGTETDADGIVSAYYQTMREAPFDVKGAERQGAIDVTATIYRIEESEHESLIKEIFGSGDAGDALKAILGPVIADVAKTLGAQARATGKIRIPINYHEVGSICLDGVWELDLDSASVLLDQLTGDAFDVTGISGSVIRAYQRNGTFIERHAGLFVEVESIIGTRDKPLHTIDQSVVMSGHSIGRYDIADLVAATSTVTYSNIVSGGYLVVGRTVVDDTVSSASDLELPIFAMSESNRDVTCAGDTFIETWEGDQYLLRWNRIGDSGPVTEDGEPHETPHVFGSTATVEINVGGAEYKITGGTCMYLPMGSQRYFTLNMTDVIGDPDATPNLDDPHTALPNQFNFSFPVNGDGEYELGENPPTGRLDGAAFQMQPVGSVTFDQNVTKGRFSGRNVKVFGGENITGKFSCF